MSGHGSEEAARSELGDAMHRLPPRPDGRGAMRPEAGSSLGVPECPLGSPRPHEYF